jgi:hypothetical protein
VLKNKKKNKCEHWNEKSEVGQILFLKRIWRENWREIQFIALKFSLARPPTIFLLQI